MGSWIMLSFRGSVTTLGLAVAWTMVSLVGCWTASGALEFAIQKYQAGQYPAALEDLKDVMKRQGPTAEMNVRGRTRYSIFRGLAQAKVSMPQGNLDDWKEAKRWLADGIKMFEEGKDRDALSIAEEKDARATLAALDAEIAKRKDGATAAPTSTAAPASK